MVERILGGWKKRKKRRREKMSRENFLEGVWLGGGDERKRWGLGVFFLCPPESFLPKMGRKLLGEFDLLI